MTAELIERLVRDLNREGIRYCHWKSNFALAGALQAETDLDLLVDRKDLARLVVILLGLGFKQAGVRTGIDPNGIFHYYGQDDASGQLVHVHLFSSIITGESFVKTHLLPLECMLLENTYDIGDLKVTSKAAELVIFILRNFIKYGSLLDVLVLARQAGTMRKELEWLLQDNSVEDSLALLKKYCPSVEAWLFNQCLQAVKNNASLPARVQLAGRVRSRLTIYSRYHLPGLVSDYARFTMEKVLSKLGGRRKNKTLKTGGAVIAFVGAEATGKSTLVSESRKWLGGAFAARSIHAGKPPSTWLTFPLNLVLPYFRRLMPGLRTTRQDGKISSSEEIAASPAVKGWKGLVYAARSVSLAWDRRQLLVKAHYLAANGEIVICDRYPSENTGTMDSPRLWESNEMTGLKGRLYNRLARLERKLYQEIPPPDLALKLKVSMEVARQRNRDRVKAGKEDDAYLEARHRQSQEWCMAGTKYVAEINTEGSLDDSIRAVKRQIWEVI